MFGVTFGQPQYLTLLPIVCIIALIVYLIKWRKGPTLLLRRITITVTCIIAIALIFVAFAQPFVIRERTLERVPTIDILFDNSASMQMYRLQEHDITGQIEGIAPYTLTTFGDNLTTPVLRTILSKVEPNAQLLLVTDGRDTEKDVSYQEIISKAQENNAKVHVVNLSSFLDERSIIIDGPQTSLAGVENIYTVRTSGEGAFEKVVLYVDDKEVASTTQDKPLQYKTTFNDQKTHTVRAELFTTRDTVPQNNVYYKTTRIIPKPPVLYVGNDNQMVTFLQQFTNVTTQNNIPSNLNPYTAVVLHNQKSQNLQNIPALQEFVASGNGLVVIGGQQAFEYSNYDGSALSPMLPVVAGKSGDLSKAALVIVIDVSASAGSTQFGEYSQITVSELIQLLSYSITRSISGENLVGVIAFAQEAHKVSELQTLGPNRQNILNNIQKLRFDLAGTQIHQGLGSAWQMLSQVSGPKNIILISDGHAGGGGDGAKSIDLANKMGEAGVKVYAIGVGENAGEGLLRQIADRTNGVYLQPRESERLNVIFGDINNDKQTSPRLGLEIVDTSHPITQGITQLGADLSGVNYVIPKNNARLLTVTTNGDPAVVSWRYGIGRVTTITAFTGSQQLGQLLAPPDSRLLARSVSYAVGDPEKKLPSSLRIDDTTLGKPAKVSATGNIPTNVPLLFTSVTDTYHTSFIYPENIGILKEYDATFAVSYPDELQELSFDTRLHTLAEQTNGITFNKETVRQIAQEVEKSTKITETQAISLAWIFLVVAALILLIGIFIRKVEEKLER